MEDYKKKYEEALERAKDIYNDDPNSSTARAVCEQIFPELKDKGERIRKNLREFLLDAPSQDIVSHHLDLEETLNWLEKQGSIDKINEKLRQYREYLIKETERWHKKEEDETLSKIGKQDCIGHAYAYCSTRAEFEDLFNYDSWPKKQGEQKPTDKVEPKFKVGDTIRLKGSLAEYTIESISEECYHGKGWGLLISCDDDYELVEQKPVEWSAYDKATLEYIIEDIKELCDNETEEGSIDTYNRELNLLQAINNSIKLSSYTNPAAWSEEDEKILKTLINDAEKTLFAIKQEERYDIMSGLSEIYIERLRWLKSIKDRVQPQPKKEWCEEDEETIDRIYNFIWKNRKGDTSEIYQQEKDANWLKSLKERMKGE